MFLVFVFSFFGVGQIKKIKNKNLLRCCLYKHVVEALLRTDNTQNRLILDVRGTVQRAAHSGYVVEIKSTVEINLMKTVAFMIAVQTRVLSGVEIFMCCSQDSRVLGLPARRTGVGAGHHDAGGQRDPAHGAGQ